MFKYVSLILLLAALSFAAPGSAQGGGQVYAYYFGWHTSGSWNDSRLIDRPAAPYNSLDAGVVGRQIDEARGAGIDAFILAWYGPADNNITHQSLSLLLDQAAARGFKTGVSVDLGGSYNATADATIQTLRHLINERVTHPAYVRYNGKPVIYFWNQGRFSVSDWAAIRGATDPGHSTIWVMEGTDTAYLGVFDGLYLFNIAWSYDFAGTAAGWRTNTLSAGGSFYSATAMPGWDESRIGGRDNPTGAQGREGGNFLAASFAGAAGSGANAILIVSWNEYLENSHIEPSQAHGAQALDTLRPLIAAWKGGGVVSAPPAGNEVIAQPPSAPAGSIAPGSISYTLHYTLRLRAAPGEGGQIITEIPYQTALPVLGRSSDATWVQVTYQGQTGWVSASYGAFSGDVNGLPIVQ